MNLAFVGLGRMGTPIARNLSGAGHTVTVYNRTRNKAEELQSAGAQVANSPAEACSRAEAVFTMLSDDIAASEVVFGHDGVISGLPRNAIHLSVSIGMSMFPFPATDGPSLIRQADAAMYQAKRQGRGATRFYVPPD